MECEVSEVNPVGSTRALVVAAFMHNEYCSEP